MTDRSSSGSGITFAVSPTVKLEPVYYKPTTINSLMKEHRLVHTLGGTLLLCTQSHPNTYRPELNNGFVGACLTAYSNHYHLKLSPDQVWIAVTTALSNYIDKHAEEMRHVFVDFDGKKELVVFGGGNIQTTNYDCLIAQISDKVDELTKGDIRTWLECDFTTSTQLSRTVSKLVLMGAMKHYFSYKMCLCCGLPKVTLEGSVEDWRKIRERVDKMATWNVEVLGQWAKVLGHVLDQFVFAFENKIDADFWNRIARETGGGSGPSYLQGWILAFLPFNDAGRYVLNDLETILTTNKYGRMDTNDVPANAVEVPVTIDDNGRVYSTKFYAGALATVIEGDVISPSLDWALVDMTDAKSPEQVNIY